jgi:nucleoporin NDC1
LTLGQNTAFWELALITERFDDRRKTIYGELDRSKGSTGKQISKLCLNELNQLVTRTKVALNPSYVQDETGKEIVKQDTSVTLVPRIVTPPEERKLLGPPIAPVTRLQRLEAAAADIAKQHSSPANTQDAAGRYVLRKGQDGFDEGRNKIGSAWDNLVESASQTPIGWLWRKSVRREANAWVFGSPYSRKMLIYNAITILTNLAVASLKEDVHGQFQNEVPDIVRAITAAIKALEDYAKALKTTIPEIEEPKTALKEALGKILGAFNEYLSTMGMTCTEIQEAKECLAKQMEEKRSR